MVRETGSFPGTLTGRGAAPGSTRPRRPEGQASAAGRCQLKHRLSRCFLPPEGVCYSRWRQPEMSRANVTVCRAPARGAVLGRAGTWLLLAFPVVDGRDLPDYADAAERDFARARVVTEVGGAARSVGEQRQAASGAPERVCDTCPGRACDHAALLQLVLLVAEQKRALALEHDEELLFGRMAMGRAGKLPRSDRDLREPAPVGANGETEIAADAADRLLRRADRFHVLEPGEIAGAQRARFLHLGRALGGLEPEGMIECPRLDPAYAQPGDVRAGQEGSGVADVLREGEHVEAVGAGLQGVWAHATRKDEAVRLGDVEVDALL